MSKPSSLQDVKTEMELSGACRGIFKIIGYFVNPSCGNSYRGMFLKIAKTRLCNRLSDISLSVTDILCTSVSITLLRSFLVNVKDPDWLKAAKQSN